MNTENNIVYEKEFEAEYARCRQIMPVSFDTIYTREKETKNLCYGFYLFGRRITSEMIIEKLKKGERL